MGKNKQKNKQKNQQLKRLTSKKNNGSVVILSCIRDCEKYIHTTIKNMQAVGEMFQEYSIFFYENDSKDKTLSILKEYAEYDEKIHYISTSMLNDEMLTLRTWRLAAARQALLKNIVDMKLNVDYVIVMDADDTATHTPFKGGAFIKQALQRKEHWDGCFPPLTYDMWAYRTETCHKNYWELRLLESMHTLNPGTSETLFKKIYEVSNTFDENNLQRVVSAFNGIGIYRYDVYCKGEYSGKNEVCSILTAQERLDIMKRNKPLFIKHPHQYDIYFSRLYEDCEHVSFHKSLGKNIRLCCCNAVYYPSKNLK